MRPPRIYGAINAVSRRLAQSGIAKSRRNDIDGYSFRGIDDVMQAVSPLLQKHRICILPRLTECITRPMVNGHHVTVRGAYDFVSSADGSCHTVETYGEAADESDKATSKAMSAAYKYALVQAFCIPIRGAADPDESSPSTAPIDVPVQGWGAWALDIISLIEGCETYEAVAHVQRTYGNELRALASARRPEYAAIGQAVSKKRKGLVNLPASPLARQKSAEA